MGCNKMNPSKKLELAETIKEVFPAEVLAELISKPDTELILLWRQAIKTYDDRRWW